MTSLKIKINPGQLFFFFFSFYFYFLHLNTQRALLILVCVFSLTTFSNLIPKKTRQQPPITLRRFLDNLLADDCPNMDWHKHPPAHFWLASHHFVCVCVSTKPFKLLLCFIIFDQQLIKGKRSVCPFFCLFLQIVCSDTQNCSNKLIWFLPNFRKFDKHKTKKFDDKNVIPKTIDQERRERNRLDQKFEKQFQETVWNFSNTQISSDCQSMKFVQPGKQKTVNNVKRQTMCIEINLQTK